MELAQFAEGHAESFPDSVQKLANGAWRWGSDPDDEWRDPPAPPEGQTRTEWETELANRLVGGGMGDGYEEEGDARLE
jgi:hypothetical protein